jgi:rhodanese-related sulfurtransferase
MGHGYRVVTPEEVAALLGGGEGAPLLLDVRTPEEFRSHRIPGVLLIPVDELNRRYQELDPDRPTVCVCEHGVRSEAVAAFLAHMDFADVSTMRGGMSRWTGPFERG